jgi:hypothetical protein
MKSILTKIQVLSFLCALPALANDVGLHNSSAQPTRAKNAQRVEETTQTKRIVGVCEVINGVSRVKDEVKIELDSKFHAGLYMANYEGKDLRFENNPQFTIIQPPTHGRLLDEFYYPEKGYFGKDFSIIRVKENGVAVDIYYFLRVLENVENEPYNNNCPVRSEGVWKISTTPKQSDPARRLG